MGRVHPKKGCDLLIEAFAKVLAQHSDWHLVIAGPDQVGWQEELNYRAAQLGLASRITWTGMIERCPEVGCTAGGGSVRAAVASGKLRHRGG